MVVGWTIVALRPIDAVKPVQYRLVRMGPTWSMIAFRFFNSAIMDPWHTLNTELDAWSACGKAATLWWRDDDAVAPGPILDRLFAATETTGLLLAVIPANTGPTLASAVADAAHVVVAQHGYSHTNHAARGQGLGAWELGLHRAEQAVLDDLDAGRLRLEALFRDDFIPVIVPPWNRLDPALLAPIKARGFAGVSRFGPRAAGDHCADFATVNSHCDLIRWKTGATFKGEQKTINQLVEHLHARRNGTVDTSEPTGFLTHHIDMDEEGWLFSEQLVQCINRHPAAHWCDDVRSVFGINA